jgi:phosphate-selective porin OprO/OprP
LCPRTVAIALALLCLGRLTPAQQVPVPLPAVENSLPPPSAPVARVAQVQDSLQSGGNLSPDQAQAIENRIRELEGLPPAPGTTAAQEEAAAATPLPSKPTVNFTGQLQADNVQVDQSESNKQVLGDLSNFTDFRRARLGAFGNLTSNTIYRLEFDFALQGRPTFLDIYGQLIDLPVINNLRIGHFFEPFAISRLTSNRFQTFMERPLLDAFAPARNMGVMAFDTYAERHGTWQLGLFGADSNDFDELQTDRGGEALTGRITYLPIWDEPSEGRYYMHVGACGSLRWPGDRQARYGYWPGFRPGAFDNIVWPRWVDTGLIPADNMQLFDLEWATVWGPVYAQAEYARTFVTQINGPNLTFDAWYAEVGWFLTGEHRPYLRETAIFNRPQPFENFFRVKTTRGIRGGIGAWEVACRADYLNLNDQNIQGGKLFDLTFGLNWYINPYTRVYFNYVHAFLTRGAPGQSDGNLFGLRAQFEF